MAEPCRNLSDNDSVHSQAGTEAADTFPHDSKLPAHNLTFGGE